MKQLHISPDLALPLDAITETFGILAVKRAGKSNAGVVIAEEMFKAGLPWIAIDPKGDWWGMRSSADGNGPGLPIVVFGGLHADVPLEPSAGQLVADIVVDQRLTCVIDVSEMTKADMRRFLTPFIKRLYQRNREPLHVFAEEADEYIPQVVRGDDAEMVGVWETLVKRGGFRGLGCTLITQRSASLNNDVLTQIQTLFALRTTGVPDRKRVDEWVSYHQAGKELVQQLPTLADGEALLFSPNFLRIVKRIRFRRRETFDSGATPKVGVKARPPVTLADVDLDVLRQKMAATIEKAKADDPRELRKRIQELERQLVQSTKLNAQPKVEIREVERIVYVQQNVDVSNLRGIRNGIMADLERFAMAIEKLEEDQKPNSTPLKGRVASLPVGHAGGAGLTPPAPPARPVPSVERSNGTASKDAHFMHPDVTNPQQRILDSLAWAESVRIPAMDKDQLALIAGVSHKSSGYANNLGALRSNGLITKGGPVALTEAGRELAVMPPTLPTTEELQQAVMLRLTAPQARILQILIEAFPADVGRDELAERAQTSPTSSGYANNLGRLRSLGLISKSGPITAQPVLFLEEVARR